MQAKAHAAIGSDPVGSTDRFASARDGTCRDCWSTQWSQNVKGTRAGKGDLWQFVNITRDNISAFF
jgi:hypothetical protein